MPKRIRESPVTFVIENGYVLVECREKNYIWFPPANMDLSSFLDVQDLEFNVLYDEYHKPILDVENIRKDEVIFQQEITPLRSMEMVG